MSLLFSRIAQITIFDIPHILDQICDDLSKDDLLVCLDVSRAWRILFTPQALRHVRFSNLKSHQTWTILNRTSLIRSLKVDISDAGWFLNNPNIVVSPFNNLCELHCVDFNYTKKPKPGPYFFTRPPIFDQSENALLLIALVPKLHTLTIDNISRQYRTDHFTEDILKSIYTHNSLTKISIRIPWAPSRFMPTLLNSLPKNLQDFEFSVKSVLSSNGDYYPATGQYSWHYKNNQQGDITPLAVIPPLQHLERLVLGQRDPRVSEMDSTEPLIIDPVNPSPPDEGWIGYYPYYTIGISTVRSYLERAQGLRYLVIEHYCGYWKNLLQVIIDNCPDIETIRLSSNSHDNNIVTHATGVPLRGSFGALREFRMTGPMSDQLYNTISRMVIQSASTLEIVWFDRWNYSIPTEDISNRNPFHIGTTTSWTRCERLKELSLYRKGGALMTDHCWDIGPVSPVFEVSIDYGIVFSQLEKLRFRLKEVLWRECPDRYHLGVGPEVAFNWEDNDEDWYTDQDEEEYYAYFDEKDDEDWKPLKNVASKTKEEKIREHEKKLAERLHQRAFIIQVRELFSRIKDLKHLQELEIEWVACSSIRDMSLELALELFKETEVKEYSGNKDQGNATDRAIGTPKGWWGKVTQDDLVWLCLPWSPQQVIQTSGVAPELIMAAARQYGNKTQVPGCCDDTNGRCNHEITPWSTGDIFKVRIGRSWRDWGTIASGSHPYGLTLHDYRIPRWYHYNYYRMCYEKHTMHSRDFEIFVEGDAEDREEALWGRKKATRGEGGRYRQKAIGKRHQRK
ncbi:hypothetical protein EC991_009457 [Linnemannia zychae]|nr:hypothetical protein EC991_009457 [Linnemannia zychae]